MQQLIPAGLVDAPVAETVRAENHDVRAVERIKAVDCRSDVLNVLFRKLLIALIQLRLEKLERFFYAFSKPGVHFHLSLQINGTEPKQQSSQILKAFFVSLWAQKSCCREVREELRIRFLSQHGFRFSTFMSQ